MSASARRALVKQAGRRSRERKQKEAERIAFGDAWATVSFVQGEGYHIVALHDTKDRAEAAARAATQVALDDAKYAETFVYKAVFAVAIEETSSSSPKYERGKPYLAALRAAKGGHAHSRAIFLYETQAELDAAVAEAEDDEPEKILTDVGGPVTLAKKKLCLHRTKPATA